MIIKNIKKLISNIASRFRKLQIKAVIKTNDEMPRFYWPLGRDMDNIKKSYSWVVTFILDIMNVKFENRVFNNSYCIGYYNIL